MELKIITIKFKIYKEIIGHALHQILDTKSNIELRVKGVSLIKFDDSC